MCDWCSQQLDKGTIYFSEDNSKQFCSYYCLLEYAHNGTLLEDVE